MCPQRGRGGRGGLRAEHGRYARPWAQLPRGEAAGSTGAVLCADPEQQDEGRRTSERERRPSAHRDARRCAAESSTAA